MSKKENVNPSQGGCRSWCGHSGILDNFLISVQFYGHCMGTMAQPLAVDQQYISYNSPDPHPLNYQYIEILHQTVSEGND